MFSAMLRGSSEHRTNLQLTLPVLTCFSNTFAMSAGMYLYSFGFRIVTGLHYFVRLLYWARYLEYIKASELLCSYKHSKKYSFLSFCMIITQRIYVCYIPAC